MPRLMPPIAALILLLIPAGGALAAPKEYLQNPGFEQPLADHAWMPAGWDTSQSGLTWVFFGRDTLAAHSGRFAANVANVSSALPMAHNWSQTLPVTREVWGKDAVLTVWTRSVSIQGRPYVLLQAYRDTLTQLARTWNIDREQAAQRLHISLLDDPIVDLGWKRLYFTEAETDWVQRQIRVYVPPLTNFIFVRLGLLGTGQVFFDDASLTFENALPAPPVRPAANLLVDPSFEGDGNGWEFSVVPYEGLRCDPDSAAAHGGRKSIACSGNQGPVKVRSGVCQVVVNRNLAGKRVRLTGHFKTDSLGTDAFLMMYAHTSHGVEKYPSTRLLSGTNDWTSDSIEVDLPADTYAVWCWFQYTAPTEGVVYFDDMSLMAVDRRRTERSSSR